jgi:hypothetical protein
MQCKELRTLATSEYSKVVEYTTPCFPLSRNEHFPNVIEKRAECNDAMGVDCTHSEGAVSAPSKLETPPAEVGAEAAAPAEAEAPAGTQAPPATGEVMASGPSAPSSEPSDAELEAAIVRAVLDGRGAVAEVLADVLRARLAKQTNVVRLPKR